MKWVFHSTVCWRYGEASKNGGRGCALGSKARIARVKDIIGWGAGGRHTLEDGSSGIVLMA
jgi:hypothetical protein